MDRDRYAKWRAEILSKFESKHRVEADTVFHVSSSGRFSLEVQTYSSGTNSWDYSRGVVRAISGGQTVADVKRNYGIFWHTWVTLPTGHEYLLCGEDYQGYSVVALDEKRWEVHFPDEAFTGGGFCWAAAHPSPDGSLLAVDGCYWACPYELVVFDFSKPMALPLVEVARIADYGDFVAWTSNDAFDYVTDFETDKKQMHWKRV